MKLHLKNIVRVSVPAALVAAAGSQNASADEVQSVAAQVIAQVSKVPPVPPTPTHASANHRVGRSAVIGDRNESYSEKRRHRFGSHGAPRQRRARLGR